MADSQTVDRWIADTQTRGFVATLTRGFAATTTVDLGNVHRQNVAIGVIMTEIGITGGAVNPAAWF